ncbi:MAG: aminotransferase class V-fold PLP-dependent enzyme [Armatimonadota bacterium]|nr:aminotransferase class V-fold PLP-dependent enzyme [Armatimonadota bacterium]
MATTARDHLLAWRDEFPILATVTHLSAHSTGPMPRGARDWLQRYADEWSAQAEKAWGGWATYLLDHAGRVGALIGAPWESIVFHANVSTLASILLSAIFTPEGRSKIVTTDLNFPSVTYNFQMHQQLGLRPHLLQSPDGVSIPLEAWEQAIDDETLAVVIDHGIFRSGCVQDVAAIVAMAHARGALAIVDAYQTTGCVPYDVRRWDADVVLGGFIKWLCGGPGAAWMYVKPSLIEQMEPRVVGWFSHARPFKFELDMHFAHTATRFATGTPNIAPLYASRAGLDIVLAIGVEAIREKSLRLTQRIIDMADTRELQVKTPREPARRGGMVCVDFPGAQRAERKLAARGIMVDYRPRTGIRISPHFYTTDAEIDHLFAELDDIRARPETVRW